MSINDTLMLKRIFSSEPWKWQMTEKQINAVVIPKNKNSKNKPSLNQRAREKGIYL
jgi:hypothetical protein